MGSGSDAKDASADDDDDDLLQGNGGAAGAGASGGFTATRIANPGSYLPAAPAGSAGAAADAAGALAPAGAAGLPPGPLTDAPVVGIRSSGGELIGFEVDRAQMGSDFLEDDLEYFENFSWVRDSDVGRNPGDERGLKNTLFKMIKDAQIKSFKNDYQPPCEATLPKTHLKYNPRAAPLVWTDQSPNVGAWVVQNSVAGDDKPIRLGRDIKFVSGDKNQQYSTWTHNQHPSIADGKRVN